MKNSGRGRSLYSKTEKTDERKCEDTLKRKRNVEIILIVVGTWNVTSMTGKEKELSEDMDSNGCKYWELRVNKSRKKRQRLTAKHHCYFSAVSVGQRAEERVPIVVQEK